MYYRDYYYPEYYSEADLEDAFALGYKDASEEMYYYTPQYTEDFLYEAYLMGKQAARDDEESTLGALARGAGGVLVPVGAGAAGGALAAHLIKAPDLSEHSISQAAHDRLRKIQDAVAKRQDTGSGEYFYTDRGKKVDVLRGSDSISTNDPEATLRALKRMNKAQQKALGFDKATLNELTYKMNTGTPLEQEQARQKLLDLSETMVNKVDAYDRKKLDRLKTQRQHEINKSRGITSVDYDTQIMRDALAEHGVKPGLMTKLKLIAGGGWGGTQDALMPYEHDTSTPPSHDLLSKIERGERRLQTAGRLGGIAASAIGSGLLAKGIYDRMVG